jgi:signal transduction histidine kinase
MKLRSKFLLATLLISTGLTAACLLMVRSTLGRQARENIAADLHNSLQTFNNVQQHREAARVRSATLVADLPIVRALMTTEDERTIQDEAGELARLAETDLLVMVNQSGKLMALRTDVPSYERNLARTQLLKSLESDRRTHWWFGGGRLWEVSVQPIYFGPADAGKVFGHLAFGYQVDDRIVRELSEVAESDVTFFYGDEVVRSTLPDERQADLVRLGPKPGGQVTEAELHGEPYLVQTLQLESDEGPPVRLVFAKSLNKATAAMHNLNRLLMATGLLAVGFGAVLVFLISHTFTRPLQSLVAGVRALGKGDYAYPLESHGNDEIAELTTSFERMRTSLQTTQRELLENEKLATIGRMASSISHDLRHHLAAIMANAEFLVDARRDSPEREELYQEVKSGVSEMNELIESLLEFSRTRASLHRSYCSIEDVLLHAIQTAKMHPAYHDIPVVTHVEDRCEGNFDSKKLERVFHNLLLNSFAATAPQKSPVEVSVIRANGTIEARIKDYGSGIPVVIQDKVFEPFFSSGKENGTGLGLSVAQKIILDHGGELSLESSSPQGTVFRIVLPVAQDVVTESPNARVHTPKA